MVCCVGEAAAGALWRALLSCRRYLRQPEARCTGCACFVLSNGEWSFEARDPSSLVDSADTILAVVLDGAVVPSCASYDHARFEEGRDPFVGAEELRSEDLACLRLYLPVLLGEYKARQEGRSFVTAHLAQSLDGRVACANGHSRWISNDANLRHAHRLRALHDAVVVGRVTVERDDPQLTVRHVQGENPRRVILNASASLLASEVAYNVFDAAGSLLLCRSSAREALGPLSNHEHVEVLPLDRDEHTHGPELNGESSLAPARVCAALRDVGQYSLFLEGGAAIRCRASLPPAASICSTFTSRR